MKVFSPLDIEHVKIAASRLRKDLPNRKHTELLHIAAHAFYGVANFHELQRRVVSQLPTPERFQRKIPTLHDAVSESASSVSQLNAWVGSDYDAGGRLLILLESTWGGGTQKEDVLSWAAGGLDATFSRMYRVLAAPGEGRLDFFNRFACMNLVPDSLGPTTESKVTTAQLRQGASTLLERLELLKPRAIWVASKKAGPFAVPIVEQYGAHLVYTAHPLYPVNISDEEMRRAFNELRSQA